MSTRKSKTMAAAMLLATSMSAHAALVTTPFTGTIDFAAPSNPFGVTTGGTVFASATYDDALVAAVGPSTIEIDSNAAFDLGVTIGDTTLTATQDSGYGFGWPQIHFQDGELSGVDMIVEFTKDTGTGPLTMTFGTEFPGFINFYIDGPGQPGIVAGTFILPPAPVPIPPALFLFGTALAGLAVIGRRLPLPGLRPTEPQPA